MVVYRQNLPVGIVLCQNRLQTFFQKNRRVSKGNKDTYQGGVRTQSIYEVEVVGLKIRSLQKAIETIKETITAKGGKIDVKMAPKAVSVKEETELQDMMERLAMENEEVDGDAPEEE